MVKNMDDIEITNFKYWPPLDELGGEGFNDLNCFDIDDQHI